MKNTSGLAVAKPASRVWAGVRLDPDCEPNALTSLNSAAYSGLVMAGRLPVRHWRGLVIVSGVTVANWPNTFALAGATNRHLPTSLLVGNGSRSKRPSVLRSSSIAAAAWAPMVIPAVLAGPGSIIPSDTVSMSSILVLTAGSDAGVRPTRTS